MTFPWDLHLCLSFLLFQKGLVDFYEEGKPKDDKHDKNGTGWGMVLGCLGAVALGALIVNRA